MRSLLAAIIISFVFFAGLAGFTREASAHTLLIDGNIGAVFYTDPDDNPPARIPVVFNFDFKDTTGALDLNLCDCTFSILTGGSPIYSGKLGNDPNISFSTSTVSFSFVLPTIGDYTIVAAGGPAATGNFQSFRLSYDLPVNSEAVGTDTSPFLIRLLGGHTIHIILFGAAILISIGVVIRDQLRLRKKRKS